MNTKPEIAMVIYPNGSSWYWRIEIDGKTVEDASLAYATLSSAVQDARQAHIDHMVRAVPARQD